MQSVDFTETEAKQTSFKNCDLKDSIFDRTNLERFDFYSVYNLTINPSKNHIKNAIFSKENCYGLLNSFHIIIK